MISSLSATGSVIISAQKSIERAIWLSQVLRSSSKQKRVHRKHNRLQVSINAKRKNKRK